MLKGKSIYLRPITLEDANDNYVAWMNDKEVNQFLESRFVLATTENVKEYIANILSSDSYVFFAICICDTHQHIGNIKLGPTNRFHKRADVGLVIGEKSFWGKGLATEAIDLISTYAFEVLGLKKLNAGCYSTNSGSERAFVNCGYEREGLFKNHCLTVEREWVDVIYLAKHNHLNS